MDPKLESIIAEIIETLQKLSLRTDLMADRQKNLEERIDYLEDEIQNKKDKPQW